MPDSVWMSVGFGLFVLVMLAVDRGVFRHAHHVSATEAAGLEGCETSD